MKRVGLSTHDRPGDDAVQLESSRDRRSRRLEQALALAQQMHALARRTEPGDAEAAAWEAVIDMDTNRPVWFPKHLHDEYQRLRFTEEGEP